MKRIFLFLVTNIAIMLVITIIINIFGLGQFIVDVVSRRGRYRLFHFFGNVQING